MHGQVARYTFLAILATTLAAAGCGSSSRRDGLQPGVSQASARKRLVQVEHDATLSVLHVPVQSPRADASRPSTRGATKRPATGNANPQSPRRASRPREAARLTATYRVTLKGGDALIPPGPYPHATGSVVLRIYGHTETCWKFIALRGVTDPRLAGIALGANGAQGLVSMFTTEFQTHGCQARIPATTIKTIERHPQQYSILVEDRHYAPSLAGEL
jgi:hypothetical protein